jgi:hypothetical protein
MSMIFEFKEMKQAETFVAAVKERFNLDGQAFDDGDEANAYPCALWHQPIPPVAYIDRVHWLENADNIIALQHQFDLKPHEIDKYRFAPNLVMNGKDYAPVDFGEETAASGSSRYCRKCRAYNEAA